GDVQILAVDLVRSRERSQNRLHHARSLLHVRDARQQHAELVAAEAGPQGLLQRGLVGSDGTVHGTPDPPAGFLDHPVAGRGSGLCMAPRIRLPASLITRSPVAGPSASLICLKRSRSNSRTAPMRPSAYASRTARS